MGAAGQAVANGGSPKSCRIRPRSLAERFSNRRPSISPGAAWGSNLQSARWSAECRAASIAAWTDRDSSTPPIRTQRPAHSHANALRRTSWPQILACVRIQRPLRANRQSGGGCAGWNCPTLKPTSEISRALNVARKASDRSARLPLATPSVACPGRPGSEKSQQSGHEPTTGRPREDRAAV